MKSLPTQSKDTSRKIRVLVIQLARLGDTLQSLMALRAAKQLYPQMEIHFIARERFAAAAKRVPWVESVTVLPTDALLSPILEGQLTETEGLGNLARWLAPLVREPWDFVVNWSYSESSSYLCSLLPSRVKLGYSRRNDATFSCVDGWSHYIQAIVQGDVEQNIHLTDILTTQLLTALQIHVGEPADDGNAAVTSKGFFNLEIGERDLGCGWKDLSRKWVGMQLGAGHPSKTWDPEKWAGLASYMLERHADCSIVLLGGPEDQPRAKRFFAELKKKGVETRNILSLVGKTDFDLWASIVGRCQWLLAGDTAAIHLASVLGTRVLNVSVGPVRLTETGPYGNGHYVVTAGPACEGCEDRTGAQPHACRELVTPEAVYAAWAYASTEWAHRRQLTIEAHFGQLGWSQELANVRVYRARIRNTQDGGGVVYEPVIQRSLRINDWIAQVLGHIARAWYCGWVPPVGQELTRTMISPTLVQSLRRLDECSEVLSKICKEAQQSAEELRNKSSKLKSDKVMGLRERDELRTLGRKLLELDKLVDRLATAHPPLLPFAQMSKVLMHNLKGDQLSDLGRESADSYRQLSQGVTLLRDWIRHTLDLAKPVAIQGASVIPLGTGGRPGGKELSP